MIFRIKKDIHGAPYIETSLTGYTLLTQPMLNKGMGFSPQEREIFDLLGHLPPNFASLEEQRCRSYESFKRIQDPLQQYVYLRSLQDSNEVLFYSLLTHHLIEMLPIVYTPVVGQGCEMYSKIYRRPRGLFIAYPDRDRIDEILSRSCFDNVKAIVVSDGERILGLGDQGAGGMGIPVGKLALYTACAGIHPSLTLPILLDTGTNNQELMNDPLYIGWRHERIRGQAYDDFIEAFVCAVERRFPHVLLQWEDFAQQNANPILNRYRHRLLTFNDDIQGTAAVATGTLLAAVHATDIPLVDHRIAVLGGGSAGCGISSLIVHAMISEGLTEQEALSRIYVVDKCGLLMQDSPDILAFQKRFCRNSDDVRHWSCSSQSQITLLDVVRHARATVLIGVSGQSGVFTEEIVREMARHTPRPIIFPLSNPTSRSEATPSDLFAWTDDAAIVSTGSPFPDVMRQGQLRRIDQTNNSYIFPGVALGLIAVRSKHISDKMFMTAAQSLAKYSPIHQDPSGNLLPSLDKIRELSFQVAIAVAKEAIAEGYAAMKTEEEVIRLIQEQMWEPTYLPYRKIEGDSV
jgi:malate dehydrogenase (oxaloacetate-decarboxylating)